MKGMMLANSACILAISSGTRMPLALSSSDPQITQKSLTLLCRFAIKILEWGMAKGEWQMAPCKMFSHLFSISLNFSLLGHLLDVTVH